jgi:hypothetical protein
MMVASAPAHNDRRIRETLNNTFPSRWVGRGSRIPFPPRSSDLTPLNFFLWSFIKDKVYRSEPTTPENMKDQIRDAYQQISKTTFESVKLSFRDRINQCIDVQGRPYKYRR